MCFIIRCVPLSAPTHPSCQAPYVRMSCRMKIITCQHEVHPMPYAYYPIVFYVVSVVVWVKYLELCRPQPVHCVARVPTSQSPRLKCPESHPDPLIKYIRPIHVTFNVNCMSCNGIVSGHTSLAFRLPISVTKPDTDMLSIQVTCTQFTLFRFGGIVIMQHQ